EEEDPAQAKLEPVQRQEGEEEEPAQAKGESSQKVKPIQAKINLAPSGGGKLMPEPVQQKMEGAFGADFSGVRIHEGPQAKAIGAVAYTQGSDIHFQPSKYQPDTQSGQELLGHELTHVVQQRAGRVSVPQGKGAPINADPGLETEADILGAKAARGDSVEVVGASSSLQRKPIEDTVGSKPILQLDQDEQQKNPAGSEAGEHNPDSQGGQELLAHEPTYVVQQSSTTVIQRKPPVEQSKLTEDQKKHVARIRQARAQQLNKEANHNLKAIGTSHPPQKATQHKQKANHNLKAIGTSRPPLEATQQLNNVKEASGSAPNTHQPAAEQPVASQSVTHQQISTAPQSEAQQSDSNFQVTQDYSGLIQDDDSEELAPVGDNFLDGLNESEDEPKPSQHLSATSMQDNAEASIQETLTKTDTLLNVKEASGSAPNTHQPAAEQPVASQSVTHQQISTAPQSEAKQSDSNFQVTQDYSGLIQDDHSEELAPVGDNFLDGLNESEDKPKPSQRSIATSMQNNAEASIQETLTEATMLSAKGKEKVKILKDSAKNKEQSEDVKRARQDKIGKVAVKSGQKADATAFKFGEQSLKEFEGITGAIARHQSNILRNKSLISKTVAEGKEELARAFARGSYIATKSAQEKLAPLRDKVETLEENAQLESAKTRMGLQKGGEIGVDITPDQLETKASDAAMKLEENRYHMMRNYSFLEMDKKTISDLVEKKMGEVVAHYYAQSGDSVATKILEAGRTRGQSLEKGKPLSDEQALALAKTDIKDSEASAEAGVSEGDQLAGQTMEPDQAPQGKGNKYIDPSLKQGKMAGLKGFFGGSFSKAWSGFKSLASAVWSPFKGLGRKVDRKLINKDKGEKVAEARMIQGLELMAMFEAQAEQRLKEAEKCGGETVEMHEQALATYDEIDAGKKNQKTGGDFDTKQFTLKVGKSWENVEKSAVYRVKLEKYQADVKEESSKYEKYGARAMGTGGQLARKIAAGAGNAALRIATLGTVGLKTKEVGAGYKSEIKATTVKQEFMAAAKEFQAIVAGTNGEGVKGLGGQTGAKAYAVMQGISTALGLLKSIFSALSLFTIPAPPVAAVFTSLTLFTTIVKTAVDLALFIWTGIGTMKTNDPRSRSKLKGNFAKHGLAFGEGASAVGAAGLISKISRDAGQFKFDKQTAALGDVDTGGAFKGLGKDLINGIGGSQHWGAVGKFAANTAIGQAIPLTNTIAGGVAGAIGDSNQEAMNRQNDKRVATFDQEFKAKRAEGNVKLQESNTKMAQLKEMIDKKIAGTSESLQSQDQPLANMLESVRAAVKSMNLPEPDPE
ncbi:DUF4157 domain-containing protein, partial [Microcoleus sp. D3_18a_C4]|uniref:DUF4157 domain-containing protein n=1 Tax=Microcoleus sp. D3_18a_C4 TaxID=3055332 RepID=UPI002FD5375A